VMVDGGRRQWGKGVAVWKRMTRAAGHDEMEHPDRERCT
jgi:hypothetical protein